MPNERLGKSLIVTLYRMLFALLFSFDCSFVFVVVVVVVVVFCYFCFCLIFFLFFVQFSSGFLLSKITIIMSSIARRTQSTQTLFIWSIFNFFISIIISIIFESKGKLNV